MATPKRGFASMSPAQRYAISSLGGITAHRTGKAHEYTSEEAKVAGQKGGQSVSKSRDHMAAIGREGAKVRWENARKAESAAVPSEESEK